MGLGHIRRLQGSSADGSIGGILRGYRPDHGLILGTALQGSGELHGLAAHNFGEVLGSGDVYAGGDAGSRYLNAGLLAGNGVGSRQGDGAQLGVLLQEGMEDQVSIFSSANL